MTPDALLSLRKARELHPAVERRLKELAACARPESFALPEGWGIAGSHRSDLVVYLHDRKVIHIELFGHPSTVEKDLNILHMSDADVKVALLIDETADPKVSEAYFRAIPDNRFHWFFVSQFLDPGREPEAIRTLEGLFRKAIEVGGPLTARGPTAAVSPQSGNAFSKVSFRVTGFHPGSEFRVFWDPTGATSLVGGASEVGTDGVGECIAWIPHGGLARPGKHALRAVDSLGNAAETTFDVPSAWRPPYLRAMPTLVRPGETLTLVGAGAPASCTLTVFLWQGNGGHEITRAEADAIGDFEASFEVPWHQGKELIASGRHRVSVAASGGGIDFHAQTYVEIAPASLPGIIEWETNGSESQDGIAVVKPRFVIQDDRVSIFTDIRNDRVDEIRLAPLAACDITESDEETRETSYPLECASIEERLIRPSEQVAVSIIFRRKFDCLPPPTWCTWRHIDIRLIFLENNGGIVQRYWIETWPEGVWYCQ